MVPRKALIDELSCYQSNVYELSSKASRMGFEDAAEYAANLGVNEDLALSMDLGLSTSGMPVRMSILVESVD